MMRYTPCLLLLTALSLTGCATTSSRMVTEGQRPETLEAIDEATPDLDYLMYVPKGYTKSKQAWPLILFLHGAGERGDDVEVVAKHGPPMVAQEGKVNLPFLIASPQCPKGDWWGGESRLNSLEALLDQVESRYRVDRNRIYLTGLSMGGFGTWNLAAKDPDRFAAIAPVCGGGDPGTAGRLARLPIWVFHGAKDEVVAPEKSEEMVEALKAAGARVQLTMYPEAGHNSWTRTYNNPEFYTWLLSHSRKANAKFHPKPNGTE